MNKKWIAVFLIILSSLIFYYNSLSTPFVYDDIPLIVENPDIKQLDEIGQNLIKYDRPLTFITFVLNYQLGRLNTSGYHLFNVIIHIFTSVLIFFLARKIIFYTYNKYSIFYPLFVSLLFASHPINTEVVTYIYNRAVSLSALFYLLCLLLFIKTIEGNKNFYIFSILSFIFSFISKQTGVTLPFMILIFDYMFLSNFKLGKVIERKYYHIPFWIIMIILLTLQFIHFGKIEIEEIKIGQKWTWQGYSYFITQPWVIIKYLQLLLIPSGLCIDHLIIPVNTIFEYKALLPLLLIAGIIISAWKLYKKRGNISKILLFSILWFFITLLPTSIFKVHIGERHLYLSEFGFYLAIVSVYFLVLKKNLYINKDPILYSLLAINILILGIITIKRNQLYQNPVLLWQDVVKKYPNNAIAYNNLGSQYFDNSEYSKALNSFSRAIEIDPELGKAHYNRGFAYWNIGEYDKAIAEYTQELKIDPKSVETYISRGTAYWKKREYDRAISDYNQAIEIGLNHESAYVNRGITYNSKQEYDRAIDDFNKAIGINPNNTKAYYNRAVAYLEKEQYEKVMQDLYELQNLGFTRIESKFYSKLKKLQKKYEENSPEK